jgi:hypothetical protein
MKITTDVRDCAATLNDKERGMASMWKEFLDMRAQVYVDKAAGAKESNKILCVRRVGWPRSGVTHRTFHVNGGLRCANPPRASSCH